MYKKDIIKNSFYSVICLIKQTKVSK